MGKEHAKVYSYKQNYISTLVRKETSLQSIEQDRQREELDEVKTYLTH